MTTTRESVREVRDGGSVRGVQDGGAVAAPERDAHERIYDEAMACIADMAGVSAAPCTDDPWPATEEIDVRAIEPPAPSRRSSSTEPDSASSPHAASALAGLVAAGRPADSGRPWRRWFSVRARRSLVAR